MLKRIFLLLSVLLLPVMLAAGVYGYLWWSASNFANGLVAQVSPVAKVGYETIRIDLANAEIALMDVRVAPQDGPGHVEIEELIVHTGHWSDLWSLGSSLKTDEWPDHASIKLQGLFYRLDSNLMKQWGSMLEKTQALPVDRPAMGNACSTLEGVDLLRALGYRSMSMDWTLSYSFVAEQRDWKINLDVESDKMLDFSLRVLLETPERELSVPALSAGVALISMKTAFKDGGINARYRRYCAIKAGLAGPAFDQQLRAEMQQLMTYVGVVLSEDLYRALADMYRPNVNVAFRIEPPFPLERFDVMRIKSVESFFNRVNPQLQINDRQVDLAGVDLAKVTPPPAAGPAAKHDYPPQYLQHKNVKHKIIPIDKDGKPIERTQKEVVKEEEKKVESSHVARVRPEFKAVPVSAVNEHVGHRARMVTYFGRRIEGRILKVKPKELVIEQRMQMGVATYKIALEKIAELEVYR